MFKPENERAIRSVIENVLDRLLGRIKGSTLNRLINKFCFINLDSQQLQGATSIWQEHCTGCSGCYTILSKCTWVIN